MPEALRLAIAPVEGSDTLSVSELNQRARILLERQLGRVSVRGEISGLRVISGHHYFALKDSSSQLAVVLFRREAEALKKPLRDGTEVVVTGKLTIYPAQGRFQLVAERVEPLGEGALAQAFVELKQKLMAEGLFGAERKRTLVKIPRTVAVVTSPEGAVIRDIINIATRRYAGAHILLFPTRVQGAEAAPQIVAAIKRAGSLATKHEIDCVVVARGGGSLEDLWCFNHEDVARAIAACPVPVVSAVGHETDVTIADFVADVRAPTPSAAAELIFPVTAELASALARPMQRCRRALGQKLQQARLHLRALRGELVDGRGLLRERRQLLSLALVRQEQAVMKRISVHRRVVEDVEQRLATLHPRVQLERLSTAMALCHKRIQHGMKHVLLRSQANLRHAAGQLDALSPLAVLSRGYAIAKNQDGTVLRGPEDVAVGDKIEVRLFAGSLSAKVEKVSPVSHEGVVDDTSQK